MADMDRLRGEIDAGRTGDKVVFPDPAAAPLGTDDEAAGTPPTGARAALTLRQQETVTPTGSANLEHGRGYDDRGATLGVSFPVALVVLLGGLAVIAIVDVMIFAA